MTDCCLHVVRWAARGPESDSDAGRHPGNINNRLSLVGYPTRRGVEMESMREANYFQSIYTMQARALLAVDATDKGQRRH
jgi:hypothetical protein